MDGINMLRKWRRRMTNEKEKCEVCSHEIMTPNYCDYCAMPIEEKEDVNGI